MTHANAPLTPEGRQRLVTRVLAGGRPIAHVAAEAGIARSTLTKWVARYRAEGADGLEDRSSAPAARPTLQRTSSPPHTNPPGDAGANRSLASRSQVVGPPHPPRTDPAGPPLLPAHGIALAEATRDRPASRPRPDSPPAGTPRGLGTGFAHTCSCLTCVRRRKLPRTTDTPSPVAAGNADPISRRLRSPLTARPSPCGHTPSGSTHSRRTCRPRTARPSAHAAPDTNPAWRSRVAYRRCASSHACCRRSVIVPTFRLLGSRGCGALPHRDPRRVRSSPRPAPGRR